MKKLFFILVLISCSMSKEGSIAEAQAEKTGLYQPRLARNSASRVPKDYCKFRSEHIDQKALLFAISAHSSKMSDCLDNFLKFNPNNQLLFRACVRLMVSKRGQVRRVDINSYDMPKDLKMCIEQELWTFDFQDLYFAKNFEIEFPLDFQK